MHWTTELYLFLSLVIVADAVILRFIPKRRPIARFVCKSILFAIGTVLLVALVRSPLHPLYRPQDLPRMFWIQVLISCWWVLAARELVSSLALMTALRRDVFGSSRLCSQFARGICLPYRGDPFRNPSLWLEPGFSRATVLAGIAAAVSGVLSAPFVVLANSWINAAAGFDVINGPLVNINPIAAMSNPASEEP
jgi:hypothetical protein